LLLESKGAWAHAEDWSRNGKWLIFSRRSQLLPDLHVLPMATGRDPKAMPFLTTAFREEMGQFSPDGRFLAYRSDESGRSEAYVRDVPRDGTPGRGKWQVSTEGGVEPRWRRDGKEIFYVSGVAIASGRSVPGTLNAVTVNRRPS
jgi:Tol biopolymer transport system component